MVRIVFCPSAAEREHADNEHHNHRHHDDEQCVHAPQCRP